MVADIRPPDHARPGRAEGCAADAERLDATGRSIRGPLRRRPDRSYNGGPASLHGWRTRRPVALADVAAGTTDVPTDPKDPQKFLVPQFDIGVPLENPDGHMVIGQRAYVRFTLDKKPLLWQWARRFWQLHPVREPNRVLDVTFEI